MKTIPIPTVERPDEPSTLEPGGPNAIAVALGMMGDEWNLQILRFALAGATRYAEFREHLPISDSVLSGRLNWLTEMGMFRRSQYQDRPARFEYELTKRGGQVWALLTAIWMWERRWVADHATPLPSATHLSCGNDVDLVLGCLACERPVQARHVSGRFGPSGGWERSVPASTTRRRSSNSTQMQFPETMTMLGNRWSSAIVGAMFQGIGRFKDFESLLRIPPTVLSQRLSMLTENGIVRVKPSRQRADWNDYRLTAKGLDFYSVIAFAFAWGQRWFLAPEGDPFEMTHRSCGAAFNPCFICSTCGKRVNASDMQVHNPEGTTP